MSTWQSKIKTYQFLAAISVGVLVQSGRCWCQLQAGVYDFGQNRYGERRGSWTPGEWLAGMLLLMTVVLGLALSIGLCYYVNKRQSRRQQSNITATRLPPPITKNDYRRQQNLEISIMPGGEGGGGSKGSKVMSSGITPPRARADSFTRAAAGSNSRRQPQQQQQPMQTQRTPNDSLIVQI